MKPKRGDWVTILDWDGTELNLIGKVVKINRSDYHTYHVQFPGMTQDEIVSRLSGLSPSWITEDTVSFVIKLLRVNPFLSAVRQAQEDLK